MPVLLSPNWLLADSGVQSGAVSMAVDRDGLADPKPTLRFFQWDQPTVSFGYLMSLEGVKRPTGGGMVRHETTDLSLSLVWPRGQNILPERPRACYLAIHEKLKNALEKTFGFALELHVSCGTESRNGVCFEEPVCNDLMLNGKKIVGGALRITRNAILYQGNILLKAGEDLKALKSAIAAEFI